MSLYQLCLRVEPFHNAKRLRSCPYSSTILMCIWYIFVFQTLNIWAHQETVKVIEMRHTKNNHAANTIKAFRAGIHASLWSRNYTVTGERKIEFIEINPDLTVPAITKAIDDAVTKHPDVLGVLDTVGDVSLHGALPALQRHEMIALMPFTGSSVMRHWNPHFYYLTTDTMTALYALVRYAVAVLRVRRLGFMYLTDVQYGDLEYAAAQSLMKGMGYALCGVFSITGLKDWRATDVEFQKKFEQFVATRPQAVLLFGKSSMNTILFIKNIMKDKRTSQVYLISGLDSQDMILSTWKEAVAEGFQFNKKQIITTGTNPLPTDTRFDAVVRFQKVMKEYLMNSDQKDYTDSHYFLLDHSAGEIMFGGWLVGEILSQMFASSEWVRNRTTFKESLFNQRRYRVDDIMIGSFGGPCSGQASVQGAVCNCNQGGRTVFFKKFGEGFSPEVDEWGEFSYSLDTCYAKELKLHSPINVVSVLPQDYPFVFPALQSLHHGASAALPILKYQKHPVTLKILFSTSLQARDALEREKNTFITDLVTGFISDDMLKVRNVTFIDPTFIEPRLSSTAENVIYLSPTIEQELFLLSKWLSRSGKRDAKVHVAVRGSYSMEINKLLERSLMTFGLSLHSRLLVERDSPFIGLPTDGDVFLIGLRDSDIEFLLKYMVENKKVRLLVVFSDFAALYPYFTNAKRIRQLTDRVIFVTSLPHWVDTKSTSTTVKAFHAAVTNPEKWTPIMFTGFALTRAMYSASNTLEHATADRVARMFYSHVVLNIDDIVYGPFYNDQDSTCATNINVNGKSCMKNYGATSLSVWSMTRAVDPSAKALYGPETPSMIYEEPSQSWLTNQQLAGFIIVLILGGALLITLVALLIYCCRDSRDNRNAPKCTEHPVTLIFTDIQSSTALWAACPEIMPDAVATHHRLIRQLIHKYECYEVKTVGDSFMIACKSASAAVQLVIDLQRTFLQHDWGTSAMDAAYHRFEERQAAEDADYEPPTARLDAAVYREYWSGLRVRVGVHTGLSDIQHDAVTKRYDYYGSTSNTAARTESVAHGGQVLLTGAAYMALSAAERAGLDVTALGPVELRGVPQPVEMYQLNAVPGRAFAKLRLDRVCEEMEFDTSTLSDTETSGSLSEELSPDAENVFTVMKNVLSAFPPQQQSNVLGLICKRWNVDIAEVKNQRDVFAVIHLAKQRLAIKVSRVFECRQLMHDTLTDAEKCSSARRGSSVQPNLSRLSSFGVNAILTSFGSKRSLDSDQQGKKSCVSFHLHRNSLALSSSCSIIVEEPSFIDFCTA